MKEIEDGLKVQKRLLESLEFANRLIVAGAPDDQINRALHWVVIGGGPTGVELTAEISDFIRSDVSQYFPQLKDRVKVTILEATGKILGMFDPKVSAYAERTLKENGAEVMCDAIVTTVSDQVITLKRKGSPVSVEYGVAVWAGGIAARPFTQSLALTIGGLQAPPGKPIRGLVVDNKFRVRDAPMAAGAPACVWAIGDCALSGSAPTAQAAFQHGSYLGRMLRDSNFDSAAIELYHPFQMVNFGAMAYVGASKGVAELKSVLWDKHPVKGQEERPAVVEGAHAFALWRSLYFSRLLSNRNKAQVVFDWSRAAIFGRDIASPFTLREENPKK
jgi:NADH:ubiquinone reductase (non-electrogenic)